MKDWFSVNLGDAMLADAALTQLEQQLSSAYAKAGSPHDMTAFVRHESEGRLHCEVVVYCSRGFAAVAAAINAHPCVKPSSNGLSVFVGSPDARQVFFPQHAP